PNTLYSLNLKGPAFSWPFFICSRQQIQRIYQAVHSADYMHKVLKPGMSQHEYYQTNCSSTVLKPSLYTSGYTSGRYPHPAIINVDYICRNRILKRRSPYRDNTDHCFRAARPLCGHYEGRILGIKHPRSWPAPVAFTYLFSSEIVLRIND
ncbi:hypothetical protein LCGC14_0934620, partial [marine sediment metagenome]